MGISREQALDCLQSVDLIGIGMEADAVRRQLHPEGVVTYAVDSIVSTKNGAFDELGSGSASSVRLSAEMTFGEFEETLIAIRQHYPALWIIGPSGGEFLRLAEDAGLDLGEAVIRLRDAGLSSFSGDDLANFGASEQLFELHRRAHRVGIRSTAGIVFGAGESLEQRAKHLFAMRELQEETGGFISFTPWCFQPAAGAGTDAPTAVEYLRTLAVSRMVLDNIENVESNCMAQGLKVVQMALRFGANDAGSIPGSEKASFTEEDLRRVIRDAGFKPVERDTLYKTMFLSN